MACPRCHAPRGDGRFCATCGILNRYPDSDAYAASRLRRLSGALLEEVLFFVTLIVGWLIWLYFTAKKSQSPAKQLLGMYILRNDGTPATARRVWARELLVKILIFDTLGAITSGITSIVDAIWILWDKDRQTLHDKLADTIVVYHPQPGMEALRQAADPGQQPLSARAGGTGAYASGATVQERLRDLRELADRGLITTDEYEERRRQILHEL